MKNKWIFKYSSKLSCDLNFVTKLQNYMALHETVDYKTWFKIISTLWIKGRMTHLQNMGGGGLEMKT